MTSASFALLRTFRSLFEGKQYKHRDSSLGDKVASSLYEDLLYLDKVPELTRRIIEHERVVNSGNRVVGIRRRRGDGTFGERVPNTEVVEEEGLRVARGQIATTEIGAEAKILAKAMIKQIDRVIGDLIRQKDEFMRGGGNPICVGIVGINHADHYVSVEGPNSFPTDGRKYKHPIQEARDAEKRLDSLASSHFDAFLILNFKATNEPPFPFEWLDEKALIVEYSAALTRITREYQRRFV